MRRAARLALALATVLVGYAWLAYDLVPDGLRRDASPDASPGAAPVALPLATETTFERPGDPLNVELVGTADAVAGAFAAAGWSVADSFTLRSSLHLAEAVVLDRPYARAPVSPLTLWGRRQDLVFERAAGSDPSQRQHVRLWHLPGGGGARHARGGAYARARGRACAQRRRRSVLDGRAAAGASAARATGFVAVTAAEMGAPCRNLPDFLAFSAPMRYLPLLLALVLAPLASAQTSVVDDFSDGNFTANPAWSGDAAKWTVAPRAGNNALALNGAATADTAQLVTPSNVSFGTWRVRYYFDFNQTTSNGTRIYLVSSSANLRGPLQGYYLQIGTNNSDDVRLYRQDGETRTQIGNAVASVAVGDNGYVDLNATRDGSGNWTVNVSSVTNTNPSTTGTLTAADATFTASSFFGVWSKHSTTANRAQAFDDVNVSGTTGPPDTAPPTVVSSGYDDATRVFSVAFSEPVKASTLTPANLAFSGSTPYTVEATGTSGTTATGARLRFSAAPPSGVYTVTAQRIEDAAGNAMPATPLTMLVAFSADVPAPGDVVVNEILFAPPTGGSEFIEVYNRSAKTFDLRDLRFIDNTGGARIVTAAPTPLAPGGYAVLAQNLATFQTAYPGVAAVQPPSWPTLNNDADAAVIKYAAAGGTFVVIDSVAYTAPPAASGVSYERRDPTGPSVAANFAPSTAAALGTPGAQNSVFFIDTAAPLALNAEETTAQTVVVTFNEPLDPASVTPARFSVGGTAPTSATSSADGLRVTLVFAGPLAADQLALAAGLRDVKGNASGAATLSIGRAAVAGDLVVNEILAAPLAVTTDNLPDQPEYVELYNRSGKALSLTGLMIVGAPDETGKADTLRLATNGKTVPAGGYVVVYDADAVDGPNPATDSRLAKAFPSLNLASPGIVLVPATTVTSGGLSNSGERLGLVRGGVLLDDVTYTSAWHNPSLRTSTGIALERRDPAAPSNEPSNWGSSPAPEGGTPGFRNGLTLAPDDPNLPEREGITVEPSPFSPDGDGNEDVAFLRYRLNANVVGGTVRVRIFNLNGRLVRTLSAAQIAGQTGQLEWDGRDDDGRGLALGPYVVLLDAVNERGGATQSFRKVVTLARQLN